MPEWFWPGVSLLVGALAAYYGARNAIQERIAKLEATQESHDDRLTGLRADLSYQTQRIDRIIEKQ